MLGRRIAPALALTIALAAVGCGGAGPQTTTVLVTHSTVTTTAPAPPTRTHPAPPARSGSPSHGSAPSGAPLPKALSSAPQDSAGVREGLVVAPLGSDEVRAYGSVTAPHAWSTIKLAIIAAVAEARKEGRLGAERSLTSTERSLIDAAIENSDNEAADSLFGELGNPGEANDALDAMLKRGGSGGTMVNRRLTRPGFSTYGQTSWPTDQAARFYRSLANGCLADRASTAFILDAMGNVTPAGGSTWGLAQAGLGHVRLKNGLGPEQGLDDYTAEQYGIVGTPASGGYAIGVVAETDGDETQATSAATDLASRATSALRGYQAPRGSAPCP